MDPKTKLHSIVNSVREWGRIKALTQQLEKRYFAQQKNAPNVDIEITALELAQKQKKHGKRKTP